MAAMLETCAELHRKEAEAVMKGLFNRKSLKALRLSTT